VRSLGPSCSAGGMNDSVAVSKGWESSFIAYGWVDKQGATVPYEFAKPYEGKKERPKGEKRTHGQAENMVFAGQYRD